MNKRPVDPAADHGTVFEPFNFALSGRFKDQFLLQINFSCIYKILSLLQE